MSRPALLVVDDDPGVRESYVLIFEDWMDVTATADAEGAVTLARRQAFDAILLDVRMPGVSGVDAFDALRAAQAQAPIIFVTAVDNAETAVRAMRLGAFDYVTKPFTMEQLTSIVRRALASVSGVVSVVGPDVGLCAAAAVLAAARGGVPVAVGRVPDAVRTVEASNRGIDDVYAEIAPAAPRLSEFITRVATYVGRQYACVKVELIAEAVGLSAGHFSRVFRDETLMAAKEYVTRVRIEVARYLLRETRARIEEIAERVGLCDAPHLTRIFRRHTGATPAAYRSAPFSVDPTDDAARSPRRS